MSEQIIYTGLTTKQMDKCQDEADRYLVHMQCRACGKWTKVSKDPASKESIPCEHCGAHDFDPRSTTSARTFNPETAKRRRIARR